MSALSPDMLTGEVSRDPVFGIDPRADRWRGSKDMFMGNELQGEQEVVYYGVFSEVESDTNRWPDDDILTTEIDLMMFEAASSASDDELILKELETLQDLIKFYHENGLGFIDSDPEELQAVVEAMHEANPEATEEELQNLIVELIAYTKELKAAREKKQVSTFA